MNAVAGVNAQLGTEALLAMNQCGQLASSIQGPERCFAIFHTPSRVTAFGSVPNSPAQMEQLPVNGFMT